MKTILLLIKIKPELLPRLKIASLAFAEKSRQKLKRIIIIIISLHVLFFRFIIRKIIKHSS